MFCIAAFIVLAIISIFSASQRKYMKKAWGCVARKVTLRPCDTNFKNEMKDKLLSHVAKRTPRLIKAADVAIEAAAWAFIILTIWSLYVAVKAGLNLYVYGTCNPSNSASCSLGSEACSIETEKPSFYTSLKTGAIFTWFGTEFSDFGKTVSNIPTRMQKWDARDYLPENASYLNGADSTQPLALEVIDPGCQFCRQLYSNIKESGFDASHNLTYIAYPIKDSKTDNGYKFANSYLIVTYLEAVRRAPLASSDKPVDWKILDRLFTGTNEDKTSYQIVFNSLLNASQAEELLKNWLAEFGYTESQIQGIATDSRSAEVKAIIERNRTIVEDKIKTVKIPTIIYNDRRFDVVVSVEDLRKAQ